MADENDLSEAEAGADGEEETSEESAAEERDTFAGVPSMRGASGVLREAIQKVMEEIEHHEREAKRHSQQARDLRKELRESFSYLLEQGEKEKLAAAPEGLPGMSEEVKQPPAGKRPKPEGKAKGAAKKGKKK